MSISASAEFANLLRRKLSGVAEVADDQIERLWQHYQLLLRWNPRLNLTRITQLEEAVDRHYAESIFLAVTLPAGPLRIADVGSGAGFPGFPIAVIRPECTLFLIESDLRKSVFLKESARCQSNVHVLAKRAEMIDGGFDWVISRAIDPGEIRRIATIWNARVAFLGSHGDEWRECVPLPWAPERVVCFA